MSPQRLGGEWGQSRLLASQPHLHCSLLGKRLQAAPKGQNLLAEVAGWKELNQ